MMLPQAGIAPIRPARMLVLICSGSPPQRQLLQEELTQREFVPVIEDILSVDSISVPSRWQVLTDKGPATLVLKAEEDIRKLSGRTRLLIASADGLQFKIDDTSLLDKHSRRLLERFL